MKIEPAGQDEAAYPNQGYAWYVTIILLLVSVTSYLDRSVIALLIEPIKHSLDITDTQISFIQGSAFALFYVLFGLPFGTLVDRTNRRNLLAAAITFWSVMTIACGLATTYWQLFIARAGVGVGEACLAPAAFSLLADYFPPQRRGRAMSVFNMANYLGGGLSLLIGGVVLRRLVGSAGDDLPVIGGMEPWKALFIIVGSPGLLIALLLFTVREVPRKQAGEGLTKSDVGFGLFVAHLRATPLAYGSAYLVATVAGFAVQMFAMWGPSFFIRNFAMDAARAGLLLGPVSAVAGLLGCLTSGILSDRFARSERGGGRFDIAAFWGPFLLAGSLAVFLAGSVSVAVIGYALVMFGSGLGIAGVAPMLQDLTPNRFRGRVFALFFILSSLLGLGAAPTLVATLTAHLNSGPKALGEAMFFIGAPLVVLALVAWLRGRRSYNHARLAIRAAQGAAAA